MSLNGYWILTSNHRLLHFDEEVSEITIRLQSQPVAIAMTRDSQGCLVLDRSGYIEAHGTARSLGDLSSLDLVAEPVDIAASPTGVGYWVIDSEGSVFSFGSAPFLEGLPQAIGHGVTAVKIEPTADGDGYWIVDQKGGVHSFGSAPFYGALSDDRPVEGLRVVDFAAGPGNQGYLFLDSDGHVYPLGDVSYFGSPALLGRVDAVGLISRPGGYLVVDARGAVTAFGDVANLGSPVGLGVNVLCVA
ncbi:MAG: hypothetical protein CL458_02935 [Acidimicrobiaceae bacterium]|nr:hypothetical protein [Acidimicrobiaceae bacterium]